VVCRGRWVEKISFGLLKDVRGGVGRLPPVPVQRLHILGRSYFHPELLNLLVRLANAVAVCRGNMATMNSNVRSKLKRQQYNTNSKRQWRSHLALFPFHLRSGLLCLDDALINCQVDHSSLQLGHLRLHALTLDRKRSDRPLSIVQLCQGTSQRQRQKGTQRMRTRWSI
jgi:hypothetical protein